MSQDPLSPIPVMPSLSTTPSVVTIKCGFKPCKNASSGEKPFPCDGDGCDKIIHKACYDTLLAKFKVKELIDPANSDNKYYCCSKGCYNQIVKNICSGPSRLAWEKDGQHGPSDPNCSMKILLDWLLVEGNYSSFRGDSTNSGLRKASYANKISQMIKDAHCRVDRTPDAVIAKIRDIESKFTKAHDWVNNTGQGVKETDGVETFESAVRQRCTWYFELEPIMGERSKARPKATTDSLFDDELSLSSSSEDNGRSVPASVYASGNKKTGIASVTASSRKKKKKKHNQTDDHDEALVKSIIEKNREQAIRKNDMLAERKRHHLHMEKMEEDKIKWTQKQQELKYKKELLETKKQLEKDGHSASEIIALFPDMAAFYDNL